MPDFTKAEAKQLAERIKIALSRLEPAIHARAAQLGAAIAEFRRRRGHAALGYPSFNAALHAGVLGKSRSFVYYCLAAHEKPRHHRVVAQRRNKARLALTGPGTAVVKRLLKSARAVDPGTPLIVMMVWLGEFMAEHRTEWEDFIRAKLASGGSHSPSNGSARPLKALPASSPAQRSSDGHRTRHVAA